MCVSHHHTTSKLQKGLARIDFLTTFFSGHFLNCCLHIAYLCELRSMFFFPISIACRRNVLKTSRRLYTVWQRNSLVRFILSTTVLSLVHVPLCTVIAAAPPHEITIGHWTIISVFDRYPGEITVRRTKCPIDPSFCCCVHVQL